MDTNSPNMGYGYSYADRAGQPCKKIEGFSGEESDSPNILMILLCILLLIFMYKYFITKK
jgi:hypothetical protein